jgi:DNA polymerase-3 subunit beta
MKIRINKSVLINGIQTVQNVISAKSALPILSNILLEAQNDKLRLTATDLDIGISCAIPVNCLELGAITVPAKRFGDIIKELPSDEVSISVKKNNMVVIEAGLCQFKIMGLGKEEFPKLPEFKDKEIFKIDQQMLKEMINLTSFAVSFDETRYILNGILFKLEKNILSLVATDGKRLAVVDRDLAGDTAKDLRIIVPIKTIHELNRNLKDGSAISIIMGGNQILFDLGHVLVISRLIEGEFPDYRQVIPAISDNKIKVEKEEFLLAVKRASLLSTPDYQAVKLEVFKNKLVVSKTTPDIGESREEIQIDYQGKEMIIGFNPVYLIDVLKNLLPSRIEMEVTDSEKPAVLRIDGYIYLVLPMRLG